MSSSEINAVETVASLMALSARTAPKGMGKDFLKIKTLGRDECIQLGEEMIKYGEEKGDKGFIRDGNNLRDSAACLLVGLDEHPAIGLDCGACGYGCEKMKPEDTGKALVGPSCIIRVLDMGIALGSAAKTASAHNVDNRIMYRAGVIARKIGLIHSNVVMAIPLSVSGKSPYYDR